MYERGAMGAAQNQPAIIARLIRLARERLHVQLEISDFTNADLIRARFNQLPPSEVDRSATTDDLPPSPPAEP